MKWMTIHWVSVLRRVCSVRLLLLGYCTWLLDTSILLICSLIPGPNVSVFQANHNLASIGIGVQLSYCRPSLCIFIGTAMV